MDLGLNGKTALVTGGSEGIGRGIALGLAREGVDVAICARRSGPLEAAAASIVQQTGRKIVAIPADLTKDADAKNFVEQAHRALGRARRCHVARHEAALRGGRQARAQFDPARAYRRGRGSGEPGRDARLAAHAHGQRHHDRNRRRAGEVADGPPARSAVLTSEDPARTLRAPTKWPGSNTVREKEPAMI